MHFNRDCKKIERYLFNKLLNNQFRIIYYVILMKSISKEYNKMASSMRPLFLSGQFKCFVDLKKGMLAF